MSSPFPSYSLDSAAHDADLFDMDMFDPQPAQAPPASWDSPVSNDDALVPQSLSWGSPPPTSPMQHDYFGQPMPIPKGTHYGSSMLLGGMDMTIHPDMSDDSYWLNPAAFQEPSSAPIAIPEPKAHSPPVFLSYQEHSSPFLHDASSFSPTFSPSSFSPESDFAALNSPISPSALAFGSELPYGSPPLDTISPQATSLPLPAWASQLWPQQPQPASPTGNAAFAPRSFGADGGDYAYARPPYPAGRRPSAASASASLLFQAASAPSASTLRAPSLARGYSSHRRSESAAAPDDPEGTIRRKRRAPSEEDFVPPSPVMSASGDKPSESGAFPLPPETLPRAAAPLFWH